MRPLSFARSALLWSAIFASGCNSATGPSSPDGSSMGGYAVIDLRAARGIGRDTELFARLGNLTGKVYETAAGYASAGRTLFVGIRHAPR